MVNLASVLRCNFWVVTILTCLAILTLFAYNVFNNISETKKKLKDVSLQEEQVYEKKRYEYINPMIRSMGSFKTVSNYICRSDKKKLRILKNINFERQTTEFLQSLFYKLISNPVGGRCTNMQRFGGRYHEVCHYWDGHKFVCMPELMYDIENDECLVYSFGVSNDWTFEKALGEIGCRVFSFDPTVNHPKELEHNVWFEKLGLGKERVDKKSLDSLKSILQKYGHENTKISYLKIDIEGGEVDGLQHWFESGALKNVQQIGMEYHLHDANSAVKFFKSIQQLYFQYDFRLISFDINGCIGKKLHDFPEFAEIVLMRRNEYSYCSD